MTIDSGLKATGWDQKPEWMSGDARKHERRPYCGQVTCLEPGPFELSALDISPAGVGLLSPRMFVPGESVTLCFDDVAHTARGTIVYVRIVYSTLWQVGVRFHEDQSLLLAAVNAVS